MDFHLVQLILSPRMAYFSNFLIGEIPVSAVTKHLLATVNVDSDHPKVHQTTHFRMRKGIWSWNLHLRYPSPID